MTSKKGLSDEKIFKRKKIHPHSPEEEALYIRYKTVIGRRQKTLEIKNDYETILKQIKAEQIKNEALIQLFRDHPSFEARSLIHQLNESKTTWNTCTQEFEQILQAENDSSEEDLRNLEKQFNKLIEFPAKNYQTLFNDLKQLEKKSIDRRETFQKIMGDYETILKQIKAEQIKSEALIKLFRDNPSFEARSLINQLNESKTTWNTCTQEFEEILQAKGDMSEEYIQNLEKQFSKLIEIPAKNYQILFNELKQLETLSLEQEKLHKEISTEQSKLLAKLNELIEETRSITHQANELLDINPIAAEEIHKNITNILASLETTKKSLSTLYDHSLNSTPPDLSKLQQLQNYQHMISQELDENFRKKISTLHYQADNANQSHNVEVQAIKNQVKKKIDELSTTLRKIGKTLDTTDATAFINSPEEADRHISGYKRKANSLIKELEQNASKIQRSYIESKKSKLQKSTEKFVLHPLTKEAILNNPIAKALVSCENQLKVQIDKIQQTLNKSHTQLEDFIKWESHLAYQLSVAEQKYAQYDHHFNNFNLFNEHLKSPLYIAMQTFLAEITKEITRLEKNQKHERASILEKIKDHFNKINEDYINEAQSDLRRNDKVAKLGENYEQNIKNAITEIDTLSPKLTSNVKFADLRQFIIKLFKKTFGRLTQKSAPTFFPSLQSKTANLMKESIEKLETSFSPHSTKPHSRS